MRTDLLRGMTALPGPYLTVCVDVRERTEDREKVIDLRWAALLDEAREAGADDETIAAVDGVISEHAHVGTIESLLVIAAHGEVILSLPVPGEVLHAAYGPVPMILPALAGMPEPVSVVVAVVDRRRAEIRIPVVEEAREEVERVEGESSLPLRKVQAGGWSQQRFQARADKAWLENAKSMAPAIATAADDVEADFIIIAGDVRERSLVHEEVATLTQRPVVVVEEGSLAPGSDDEPLDRRVEELMHEHRRQVMADLGERFGSAAAHEEPLAVDDVEALVHAAQKGQIETLLVDPVAPPSAQVWVSGDGQILGRHEEDVVALGGTDPHRVDAADALIHATVMGGGNVIAVAEPLTVTLGALLRFSDQSTALAAHSQE